jgi:hypothetical protein
MDIKPNPGIYKLGSLALIFGVAILAIYVANNTEFGKKLTIKGYVSPTTA